MRSKKAILAWLAAASFAAAACGDDTGTGGSGGTPQGGENAGGENAGGTGGENTGGENTGGENTGGENTGGENVGGEGGTGGTGPELTNGCARETAEDMTGMAQIDLTWDFGHQECLVVDVGTTVTWTGDFGFHPLVGGVVPTTDATSPITESNQSGASASVTFDEAGEFPYFCEVHLSSLQGVIYVE